MNLRQEKRGYRRRLHRHPRRTLVGVLLSLTLVVTGITVVSFLQTRPADDQPSEATLVADVENHQPATYNMQGGNTVQDSKWTTDIAALMQGDSNRQIPSHDILALQEAGPEPIGAAILQSQHQVNGLTINQYAWQVGSSTRGTRLNIYHMQTDRGGNRVNLAMVTRQEATEVLAVPAQAQGAARGAFGLRFDNTVFWTVHALSAGTRNEANELLNAIEDESTAGNGNNEWVVMGDFNRNPDTLDAEWRNGTRGYVYRTFTSTQQSGGELDYMVASRDVPGLGGQRLNGLSSDHFPVSFRMLRAAADVNLFQVRDGNKSGFLSVGATQSSGNNLEFLPATAERPDTWQMIERDDRNYTVLHVTNNGGAESAADLCLDTNPTEETESPGDDALAVRCSTDAPDQAWDFEVFSAANNSTFKLRQGSECVAVEGDGDFFMADCDTANVVQFGFRIVADSTQDPVVVHEEGQVPPRRRLDEEPAPEPDPGDDEPIAGPNPRNEPDLD